VIDRIVFFEEERFFYLLEVDIFKLLKNQNHFSLWLLWLTINEEEDIIRKNILEIY
jgi:hypothetical protein